MSKEDVQGYEANECNPFSALCIVFHRGFSVFRACRRGRVTDLYGPCDRIHGGQDRRDRTAEGYLHLQGGSHERHHVEVSVELRRRNDRGDGDGCAFGDEGAHLFHRRHLHGAGDRPEHVAIRGFKNPCRHGQRGAHTDDLGFSHAVPLRISLPHGRGRWIGRRLQRRGRDASGSGSSCSGVFPVPTQGMTS